MTENIPSLSFKSASRTSRGKGEVNAVGGMFRSLCGSGYRYSRCSYTQLGRASKRKIRGSKELLENTEYFYNNINLYGTKFIMGVFFIANHA